MTNQELIQKAVITTAQLATAGKLNPVQSDRFIDFVIDVTELRGSVRVVRFRNEELTIDKIGVGQRVTVPKTEATDPGRRYGVSTTKVSLVPKECMTPFEISDNFAENSIEGEQVEDTVVRLMATQMANDTEELMINGDTLGHARLESDLIAGGSGVNYIKDSFLGLFNGWLRLLDSGNIYDAQNANLSTAVFSGMIKKMPVKFRRTRRNLRFLLALDLEQNWREKVASRATAQGDQSLMTADRVPVFGIPLVPVPLLEAEPLVVEHITFGAGPDTQSLRYAPVSNVVVTVSTLGTAPTPALVEGAGNDYTVDLAAGTVTALSGGALESTTGKVTYNSRAQIMLADMNNLVLGIGRDIRIESDREIFKSVTQFAITTKVAVEVEEITATVKGINIGIS